MRSDEQEEEEGEGEESVVKPPDGKWKILQQLKVVLKNFWNPTGYSQRNICQPVCLISSVYRQGDGKAATRHCMAQGVPRTDNNSAVGIQILHLGF